MEDRCRTLIWNPCKLSHHLVLCLFQQLALTLFASEFKYNSNARAERVTSCISNIQYDIIYDKRLLDQDIKHPKTPLNQEEKAQ